MPRIISPLASDAAGQLHILGHDGDTLGVDGGKVAVLEEAHEVSLGGLLESKQGRDLESQARLRPGSTNHTLAHQALKWKLADQELGGLLVSADLTQSHSAGPVAVGLLHAAGGGRGLAGSLGGELLARSLATSGPTWGLLGTDHC
jgi:hypothetical protein